MVPPFCIARWGSREQWAGDRAVRPGTARHGGVRASRVVTPPFRTAAAQGSFADGGGSAAKGGGAAVLTSRQTNPPRASMISTYNWGTENQQRQTNNRPWGACKPQAGGCLATQHPATDLYDPYLDLEGRGPGLEPGLELGLAAAGVEVEAAQAAALLQGLEALRRHRELVFPGEEPPVLPVVPGKGGVPQRGRSTKGAFHNPRGQL